MRRSQNPARKFLLWEGIMSKTSPAEHQQQAPLENIIKEMIG